MWKWRIDAKDKPLLIALIVLIFLVGMCAYQALHTPANPQPQTAEACEKCTNKNQGEAASAPTILGLGANEFIAIFTAGTLAVLVIQMLAAIRANEHFQTGERGYVQMSHKGGLNFIGGEKVSVSMQVKNWGKTPATVTDHRLGPWLVMESDAGGPGPIDYTGLQKGASPDTFLIPGGTYNWDIGFEFEEAGVVAAIAAGEITLFMIGYVDYLDQFGGRWRAGYARKYVPAKEGRVVPNNLSYTTAPGLNADRPRKRGDGRDWA